MRWSSQEGSTTVTACNVLARTLEGRLTRQLRQETTRPDSDWSHASRNVSCLLLGVTLGPDRITVARPRQTTANR
jgi:hypothetical protein